MADSNDKAEEDVVEDVVDSDSSDQSNPGRSYVKKAKKEERSEKKQKFKEGSMVWVKEDVADHGTSGSLLLTVVTVYRDPVTKSLSYKLQDKKGNAYKDGTAIAERQLQSAGSGSK